MINMVQHPDHKDHIKPPAAPIGLAVAHLKGHTRPLLVLAGIGNKRLGIINPHIGPIIPSKICGGEASTATDFEHLRLGDGRNGRSVCRNRCRRASREAGQRSLRQYTEAISSNKR